MQFQFFEAPGIGPQLFTGDVYVLCMSGPLHSRHIVILKALGPVK